MIQCFDYVSRQLRLLRGCLWRSQRAEWARTEEMSFSKDFFQWMFQYLKHHHSTLKQLRSFTQFNPYFLLWVFRGSDFSSCFAYPLQSTGWGVCSGSKAETHAEGLQAVLFFFVFFNWKCGGAHLFETKCKKHNVLFDYKWALCFLQMELASPIFVHARVPGSCAAINVLCVCAERPAIFLMYWLLFIFLLLVP